ncbi:MAG: SsrA-binding protein SmpB [candidate division Zixibacteria bacterium]|nr:SsrA-binding protein SmpB [candidate division Zixibacteria bacterium]
MPIVTIDPILLPMSRSEEIRYVVRNRRARRDYEIGNRFEAGIELMGSEVKSIREGKVNLSDAYAVVEEGQVILKNLHINPYKMTTQDNHEPLRPRRLLLHKREIRKLYSQTEQRGKTLIPLALYFKGKLVKIELALAVGRKKYDKRQAIAKAETDRSIRKALRKDL